MKRLIVVAGIAVATVAAAPAFAYDPFNGQPLVTVDADPSDDGTVGVGSHLGRQPLVGAYANVETGHACVGFSYQIPACADIPPIARP